MSGSDGGSNATEHGSINNGGHFQSDIRAIEAEVKDEKRFPQKWAWFGFGKGETGTMNSPTSTCNQCHEANAAVETTH
ncbi:MAG TPA: cytochrome P460 family protein [Terriglobales bacterium]|nr:cytochrome P460 family protein [Terriglobales bacterium]